MNASLLIYLVLIFIVICYFVFPKIMGMTTPFNKPLDYWIFKQRKPDPRFHNEKEYGDDD